MQRRGQNVPEPLRLENSLLLTWGPLGQLRPLGSRGGWGEVLGLPVDAPDVRIWGSRHCLARGGLRKAGPLLPEPTLPSSGPTAFQSGHSKRWWWLA